MQISQTGEAIPRLSPSYPITPQHANSHITGRPRPTGDDGGIVFFPPICFGTCLLLVAPQRTENTHTYIPTDTHTLFIPLALFYDFNSEM